MCVVSEELSRGYIGVGSLGTRSEIAAELILMRRHARAEAGVLAEDRLGRNPADRRLHRAQHRLRPGEPAHPGRARGRSLSDQRRQDLDHPSRARRPDDLARAHRSATSRAISGLSMFLARKPRGTDAEPFPAPGMSGGEIEVLGYRGMKEYEIALRRIRDAGRQPARRRGGPGVQAIDGDLRIGAHPDRRAGGRRRPVGAGARPALRQGARAVRQDADRLSRASPTSSR